MDINAFYELRSRLYASAAAGCGLINEDFRLKRALEAFEPMAKANKVFGRLYQMCQNLFSSENVSMELADCIALADALAVTQGSFLDTSECVETENKIDLKPQYLLHSEMEKFKKDMLTTNSGWASQSYLEEEGRQKKILDPRIFPIFL